MSNNICVDFSYIDGVLAGAKKEIAPGVSNVLGSIFGYELLFLFSKNKEIQEINFFNKAVILFLEQIVIQYTGITPHYNRFIKAITLRLGDKFKSKFIFNRAKICKNYPTNFSFNIVWYEAVVNSLNNIIGDFKFSQEENFIHPGHVLLYGPSWTGKTKMISDLLIKNKLDFVFVDMNLLNNAPVENLPIIFQSLSDKKTVFLIDEFDGFLLPSKLKRSLSPEEEKQLSFWKTIFDSNDSKAKNRLIFCTSNHKDYLDEAILRPGRLENHFEVGNPDPEDRLKIFLSKCWEYRIPTVEGLSDEEIKHWFENCSEAKIDKAVHSLRLPKRS